MSPRSTALPSPGRIVAARRQTRALVLGTLALMGATQAGIASGAPARDSATPTQSLRGLSRAATSAPVAAATLEGCVAGVQQAARAATFSGQMTSVAGAQRMAIRIELEQRRRVGGPFRPVLAPGLGVWRISEAGVKIYKYIKEVTNLAAPASYRALIRFKWLGARSKVVKQEALRTAVCRQPVPAGATETPPGPGAVSGSGTPAAPVARMLT